MTYSRFMELFPDNDACLEHLKGRFFADGTECPKCEKASKFHRISGRSAYPRMFKQIRTLLAEDDDGQLDAT